MSAALRMCTMILLSTALLSGCWDRRELDELGIAVAIGIDRDGSQYKVSAQIVNPAGMGTQKGASGGGGSAPVVTYQTTGSTIVQALRRMRTKSPRTIFTRHLRIVVFGEQMAKGGIAETVDFLVRHPELPTNVHIAVARGATAEHTLRILTTLEKIPAEHMDLVLQLAEKTWPAVTRIGLNELVTVLMSEGKDAAVAGIRVSGNPEKGKSKDSTESTESSEESTGLQLSGIAVFKKDKLVGWLNERESRGFSYTQGRVRNTVLTSACPGGGSTSVEMDWMKRTIKGGMINGRPAVYIDIKGEGNVAESQCGIQLEQPEAISELEKRTNLATAESIRQAIRTAQQTYKADIFGFGETIHRYEPAAWKPMRANWDERFSDVQAHVNVELKIRRLGMTGRSIEDQAKE